MIKGYLLTQAIIWLLPAIKRETTGFINVQQDARNSSIATVMFSSERIVPSKAIVNYTERHSAENEALFNNSALNKSCQQVHNIRTYRRSRYLQVHIRAFIFGIGLHRTRWLRV